MKLSLLHKRADGVTQKVVDHWIELVQKVFKKNGLDELLKDEIASRFNIYQSASRTR